MGCCGNFGRLIAALVLASFLATTARAADAWFEDFKRDATPLELYKFLYAMPKGGDLHSHLGGSIISEWLLELALAEEARGYRYYTKVRINNCQHEQYIAGTRAPYLLFFLTIQASTYDVLSACIQSEFKLLSDLTADEKSAWLDSLRLDRVGEGRDEFFDRHWPRLGELQANPHLMANALVRNMQALAHEGLIYWEPAIGLRGLQGPDGAPIPAEDVAAIYRARLEQDDARATGMTVRFELATLRFSPAAENSIAWNYEFVHRNQDLWVSVDLVGREDNDKGYPLRFLPTLRELRSKYHGVRMSVHAGEVDEPNQHVRDTLLLGADRIGHGVNLISDPDTLLLMRNGPYLIEINLISNLMLEYVSDYSTHPFPEYLRLGVPVALSTDDRGMWDSNITDEFFVAVSEFNLSFSEIETLSRNSLDFSFTSEEIKLKMLEKHAKQLQRFERDFRRNPGKVLNKVEPVSYGFLCDRYDICLHAASAD